MITMWEAGSHDPVNVLAMQTRGLVLDSKRLQRAVGELAKSFLDASLSAWVP